MSILSWQTTVYARSNICTTTTIICHKHFQLSCFIFSFLCPETKKDSANMIHLLPTLLLLTFCWSCCAIEGGSLRASRRELIMTAPPRSDTTSFPSASPSLQLTAPPKPDFTTFPSASPEEASAPPKPDVTVSPSTAPSKGPTDVEGEALKSTAAVCAKDIPEALKLCKEKAICRYVVDENGDLTDTLVPNQPGDCVTRCDTPSGADACGFAEKCHRSVLVCYD